MLSIVVLSILSDELTDGAIDRSSANRASSEFNWNFQSEMVTNATRGKYLEKLTRLTNFGAGV